MQLETWLAQAGGRSDPRTGSLSTPIHQTATFSHPRLGESTGYDYSRTANPTRSTLEKALVEVGGGARACAFASGMAALDAVMRLVLESGRKRVLCTEDPYGGTIRLLERFFRPLGIVPVYVDTSDTRAVLRELDAGGAAAVVAEIPTNPLMRVADVAALADAAHASGATMVVDNTFLTPYLFRPFEHGADIAVYSATKYLCGHNDVIAGAAVCLTEEMGARLAAIQNATGGVLGPLDSWLFLRGLKTLAIRMDRQQTNALAVAEFLAGHPRVAKVHYPGLTGDPGHERLRRQARGFGGMLSFEVDDPDLVPRVLATARVFSFAESLGGVESLVTFPAVQTHADVAEAVKNRLGINNRLLRLSIGIENVADLIADLDDALR
ncbi:MAG: PLP-dependent aspartate aminotransferase family protein [Planctomycetota bacterium]|jgi:cystathionine beta-lyase/cystathionine gamma-synthase|nr:PLP-dependent aspartate aminotransferase family protein [Planctomycetota bacterium]